MILSPIQPAPISSDLLCIHYQYNLRTRTPADRCPECGIPVADSVTHYQEHARAVAQPALLRAGAWFLAVPSLLAIVSFAGMGLFKFNVQAGGNPRLVVLDAVLRQFVHVLFAGALFAGASLICGSVTRLIARPLTRLALSLLTAVYAVLNFFVLLSTLGIFARPGGRPGRIVFALAIMRDQRIGMGIVCIAAGVAGFSIMSRLARSLASPKLASLTNLAFPVLIANGIFSLAIYLFLGIWRFTRDAYPFDTIFNAIDLATAVILTAMGCYWLVVARIVGEKLSPRPRTPDSSVTPTAPSTPAAEKLRQFLAKRQ